MRKERLQNVLSLIFNLLIVVITVYAMWYNFRTDVIREETWFGNDGWKCFRFFTVLSNVFVAIVSFTLLFYNVKNIINDTFTLPKWILTLKFVSTVSVALTFVTVVFFLGPYVTFYGKSYFSMFTGNNFFMHLITPLLAIFGFIFCEKSDTFSFKNTFWGLIPTALYSIVYVIMVVFVGKENGGWEDFYGFTFGGHLWAAPLSAIAMLLATYGCASLIWFLHKKWNKK